MLDYVTPGKVPDAPVLEPGLFPCELQGGDRQFSPGFSDDQSLGMPIAQPVLRPIDKVPQYITCIRYSPLDEKNQPAGSETKLAIFLGAG